MPAPRRALAAKLILALATPAIAAVATVAATGAAHRPAAVGAAPRTAKMPARRAPAPAPAVPPPADPLAVKRILPIGPIRFGEYAWDAKGVPDGPLIVTVDLAAQTLSVFRGGYEIGATAILYGADDKPTPLGTFPILMKDADHVSATYGAPMPYTLRLTADGVSVHGTEVAWGYATHGCIGVPTAFARLLFREAKPGDKVIITRGRTLATGEALIG
ncbi:L,D-transpeptidase family protein [Sphingomonas sp. A2-49]|uniref:L,D-transpeptidase family protein n=1 Tax=Sphingomonas sp. A2-49 TaxID=1391375 RepID=UPI0021CEC196|nr:L,D-transpeptidase family protein [Sphingomonas sp. A2-49]MCU6454790.1 L,D-transpeptidase family protein [Sphingomonas sp. A2-49]